MAPVDLHRLSVWIADLFIVTGLVGFVLRRETTGVILAGQVTLVGGALLALQAEMNAGIALAAACLLITASLPLAALSIIEGTNAGDSTSDAAQMPTAKNQGAPPQRSAADRARRPL